MGLLSKKGTNGSVISKTRRNGNGAKMSVMGIILLFIVIPGSIIALVYFGVKWWKKRAAKQKEDAAKAAFDASNPDKANMEPA